MQWNNKRVAILGFGQEGQAMAEYLLREGAIVTVCDEQEADALGEAYTKCHGRDIHWQLGPSYLQDLANYEIVIRSPGVPLSLPSIQAVRASGVEVISQTKIFFDLCPAPIIGITGTKGKGTTSALVAAMLTAAKKKNVLVGNIGQPSVSILPELSSKYWVVYELSSFQLQDLTRSPHIAIILGLTIDHQDYHASPGEYFAAKANILRYQKKSDVAIFNIDYPETRCLESAAGGQVYHTSRAVPVSSGAYVAGDVIFLRLHGRTEHVAYRHEMALKGDHNLENVMAAVVAASLAGVSLPVIRKVLKTFRGLPHRLEFVGKINGIEYWNDSYGTNPDTSIAAIRSFVEPIVLLLGGSEKGLAYERLAEAVLGSSVKTIIGIGLSAAKMYAAITVLAKERGVKPPPLVPGGETMTVMVKTAKKFAKKGDVVLLSPAAASFDKFKNATDRGEQFRATVQSMAPIKNKQKIVKMPIFIGFLLPMTLGVLTRFMGML